MKFMIIRKADADTEAGAMPSQALATAMMDYMQAMTDAGVLRGGDGLKPSATGLRVKFNAGKPSVIDGPFAETKELIAGYTIIDVASRDEAVAWLKRWPVEDGDGEVELELREFYSVEDFGDAFTPEAREKEANMRAQQALGS
ncbi:YciI family protein [Uliginosibacterium sp. H1]|uniref:YciI family protein n=1 Tax=Uliginosibacterium sp. H1 TaxID=3114757 RepID=UPI002E198F5D|nr:YciI family protein [Uliginosibacterium sp. H1]